MEIRTQKQSAARSAFLSEHIFDIYSRKVVHIYTDCAGGGLVRFVVASAWMCVLCSTC